MFERISGFFKRFTRRRMKQSGETTIMDAREPGMDELGLDEGFGDLEESVDAVGTAPAGVETGPGLDAPVPEDDLVMGEADISTGASDFDERTVSDEISGATGADLAQEPAMAGAEFGEGEPAPYGEAFEEGEPPSFVKRVLTLAAVAIIAVILGGVGQIFLWPTASKMVGLSKSDEPKLDIQAQLNSEQRKNAKLKSEVGQFKGMGSPAEVKNAQQQLAQLRDSHGQMDAFEKTHSAAKEKEAAYNELVAKINGIESDIGKARSDINDIKVRISETRREVAKLAKQTDEEYARFRLELARAELNQKLLIELQIHDVESFREELVRLSGHLSELMPPAAVESLPESVPQAENKPQEEIAVPQNSGN